jgi:Icc-related predicted phosphoesterase
MRFAYVLDVHGHPHAVADALASLGDVELLIVGGDITTGGTADEAARAVDSWRSLAPRLLAVAGNMDSPEIDARLVDLGVSIDGRGVTLGDIGVFGVSAAPLRTLYELPDDELGQRAARGASDVRGCRVMVVLPARPSAWHCM